MTAQRGAFSPTLETNVRTTNSGSLPTPFVIVAFVLAVVSGAILFTTKYTPMAIGLFPLLICGTLRPQVVLIAAMALSPFTFGLTGETGSLGVFCIADLLIAVSFSGIVLAALLKPSYVSLGRMTAPILLYLGACLLSFYVNIPEMQGHPIPYFVGFIRTTQIILIVPLGFAVAQWSPGEIRSVLRGYMAGSSVLGAAVVVAFIAGQRNGSSVMGLQKNATGLILAMACTICISALLTRSNKESQERKLGDGMRGRQTIPEPLGMSRTFMLTCTALCAMGLVCSLSRGGYIACLAGILYICVTLKRGAIAAIVIAGAVAALVVLQFALPEESQDYVKDVSLSSYTIAERLDKNVECIRRFWKEPWLGDGMRARRDFLPHNLEMTLIAENGAIGTLLFAWAVFAQLRTTHEGRKVFSNDNLREWICMAIAASSVCVLVQSQFDPFWRRGPLWIPWAGSGFIVAMLKAERTMQRQKKKADEGKAEEEYWERREADREARKRGSSRSVA